MREKAIGMGSAARPRSATRMTLTAVIDDCHLRILFQLLRDAVISGPPKRNGTPFPLNLNAPNLRTRFFFSFDQEKIDNPMRNAFFPFKNWTRKAKS